MRSIFPILFALLIAATVGSDGKADAENADKVIGMSVLSVDNSYFKTLADAAVAEAKMHGYHVAVVSAEFDATRQSKQVGDFVERGVSAIILCPCDSKAIGPAIREANTAGIPVFTADIRCIDPEAKIVSHVATDNRLGGRQAAQALIEALGMEGGKVAILDYGTVLACRLRTEGFIEEIERHNARRIVGKIDVVAHLDGGGTRHKGMKATKDAIQAHPDLRGIFAINDPSALGASAALVDAGLAESVSIIGFDGQPEGRRAIKRGSIYADPIQRPERVAITTVQAMIKHLNDEVVASEILVPTELCRKADADDDPLLK